MEQIEPLIEDVLCGRQFKRAMECLYLPTREKYHLKQIEADVLFFLSRQASATSTDICRSLNLNKGYVSQAVDGLCRKGYLIPRHDQSDKRYITFRLTDAAKPVAEEVAAVREGLKHRLLQGITPEELAQFSAVAGKIRSNICHVIEE